MHAPKEADARIAFPLHTAQLPHCYGLMTHRADNHKRYVQAESLNRIQQQF